MWETAWVTVADAAVRYNPVYYAVVGTVARPFHGAGVDYAIRVATALMCALLLGWAASLIGTWARTSWLYVGLIVAATPTLVYSTAIASPNGVGYAAAPAVGPPGWGWSRETSRPRVAALLIAALTMIATPQARRDLASPYHRWRRVLLPPLSTSRPC